MAIRTRRFAFIVLLVVLFVSYWILYTYLPTRSLFFVSNAVAAVFSLACVVAYGKYAWRFLTTRYLQAEHLLATGIILQWTASFARSMILWYWRETGEPSWINWPILASIPWIFVAAAILQLSASGVIDGVIPRRSTVMIGLIIGISIVTVIILFAYLPFPVEWPGDLPLPDRPSP